MVLISCNILSDLHDPQIMTAANNCYFFANHSLVEASNNGNSFYCFCAQQLLSLLASNRLLTTKCSPDQ